MSRYTLTLDREEVTQIICRDLEEFRGWIIESGDDFSEKPYRKKLVAALETVIKSYGGKVRDPRSIHES